MLTVKCNAFRPQPVCLKAKPKNKLGKFRIAAGTSDADFYVSLPSKLKINAKFQT